MKGRCTAFMISEQIRKKRLQLGLSQTELARRLGVRQSTVAMWETGKNNPEYGKLLAIAETFGVKVSSLTGEAELARIPVLGKVQAGIPREAVEDAVGYEDISEDVAKTGEFFALRIRGSSMEPRFLEGDTVIVRRQSSVDNGDIAIVLVGDDEATCKKFYRHNDGITLVSLNPAFPPMFFSTEELENTKIEILGKVCELRARF